MKRKWMLFLFIIALISLSACAAPQPVMQKLTQESSVSIDLPEFTHALINQDEAIPLSNRSFLYYLNGWNDSDNTNMIGYVYVVTLPDKAEMLSTISGYHIKKIIPFGDSFLVLLSDVTILRRGMDDSVGLTLMCVDDTWSEKWKYTISDGLAGFDVVNDDILLRTYSATSDDAPDTVILLDNLGNEKTSFQLANEERIMYAAYTIEKDAIYTIVRTSHDPNVQCTLKVFDNSLILQSEMNLPFRPDDEVIVMFLFDNNEEMIITQNKIYNINSGAEKTSADTSGDYLKKNDNLKSIGFNAFDDRRFYYFGYLENASTPKSIVGLSYNSDFSSCSATYFELYDKILCAFIDENSSLVMIQKVEDGNLNILKSDS